MPLFPPSIKILNWSFITGKWGDQGNGTFRNPIIAADYSDPDPIRVGDDYYMAASTFEDSPGVHILHSKDLVNWTQIGGVFQDLVKVDSAFSWNRMKRYNEGVYAPSLRFHAGKFWIFVNFYTDGFWMATADNPKPISVWGIYQSALSWQRLYIFTVMLVNPPYFIPARISRFAR